MGECLTHKIFQIFCLEIHVYWTVGQEIWLKVQFGYPKSSTLFSLKTKYKTQKRGFKRILWSRTVIGWRSHSCFLICWEHHLGRNQFFQTHSWISHGIKSIFQEMAIQTREHMWLQSNNIIICIFCFRFLKPNSPDTGSCTGSVVENATRILKNTRILRNTALYIYWNIVPCLILRVHSHW